MAQKNKRYQAFIVSTIHFNVALPLHKNIEYHQTDSFLYFPEYTELVYYKLCKKLKPLKKQSNISLRRKLIFNFRQKTTMHRSQQTEAQTDVTQLHAHWKHLSRHWRDFICVMPRFFRLWLPSASSNHMSRNHRQCPIELKDHGFLFDECLIHHKELFYCLML